MRKQNREEIEGPLRKQLSLYQSLEEQTTQVNCKIAEIVLPLLKRYNNGSKLEFQRQEFERTYSLLVQQKDLYFRLLCAVSEMHNTGRLYEYALPSLDPELRKKVQDFLKDHRKSSETVKSYLEKFICSVQQFKSLLDDFKYENIKVKKSGPRKRIRRNIPVA